MKKWDMNTMTRPESDKRLSDDQYRELLDLVLSTLDANGESFPNITNSTFEKLPEIAEVLYFNYT